MKDKELKQLLKELRKVFKVIIRDLMDDTSGGAHIMCDLPLVISNKLVKEVKIRIN